MMDGALAFRTVLVALGLLAWSSSASARVDVLHEVGRRSIPTDKVPLCMALAEVARELGAELIVRGELGGVSDVALHDLPVDTAPRRPVAPHGLLLQPALATVPGERRIEVIHVYQQSSVKGRAGPAQLMPRSSELEAPQDGEDDDTATNAPSRLTEQL